MFTIGKHCPGKYISSKNRKRIHHWHEYLTLLEQTILKLPSYDGRIFRGILVSETFKIPENGEIVVFSTITSCSKREAIAKDFMVTDDPNKKKILYWIDTNGFSAYVIGNYSVHPGEQETVLPTNTSLEVLQTVNIEDYTMIHMKIIDQLILLSLIDDDDEPMEPEKKKIKLN